jgi:hypothetical protein
VGGLTLEQEQSMKVAHNQHHHHCGTQEEERKECNFKQTSNNMLG